MMPNLPQSNVLDLSLGQRCCHNWRNMKIIHSKKNGCYRSICPNSHTLMLASLHLHRSPISCLYHHLDKSMIILNNYLLWLEWELCFLDPAADSEESGFCIFCCKFLFISENPRRNLFDIMEYNMGLRAELK